MDETTFKPSEADLDQAAGTVDKETYMRNGVEMAKVEYSTLFQDKKKKTKRLQESVSSDRIRRQPPSEKLEETKSLELMDNVDAYHNDGCCAKLTFSIAAMQSETVMSLLDRNMMRDSIPELLALPELKHPIGSEPKPKVTINQYSTAAYIKTGAMDHTHLHCLNRLRLRIMMRDSIPELLALPELKHPIGSEPKPKEPLDGSHASPLSQQVDTQVYSPNSTQHIEKEPSNQTHAAQTQFFSTNVTQQEPLNESPASPLSQQIETQVYSPNSAQHIEKEQLDEAPDAHTQVFSPNVTQQKEIEPSLDEMPSNPNRGEENLDVEIGGKPSTILLKSNEIP
ncbi:hypothetical protein DY000_02046700 [Brassica cretica]|uniref:Uncharacterized protein n=1 Tax=Brassica cretica TaxID=69181 RepID=A0ABQ7F996_BRACR|nr:hypothetical protein DY000_02046700 [Brassica cretica]